MPRTRKGKEWIGRNDDAMPPQAVFDRLWDSQGGKDAITGKEFQTGDKVVRDHIVPLADGGENRESNLQLIVDRTHKEKTAREATERARYRARRASHRGYKRKKSSLTNKKFKRLMDGTVVKRDTGDPV